jgi:lysophospholipase L1-like esterase
VIGASFAAGVGAHSPSQAWPADLGRSLHWQVRVSANPGSGYISSGAGHRGPFTVLANRLNLAQLRPAVVLIQGGHNDMGQPVTRISQSVRNLLNQIHCETPGTRVGIVTVFATGDHPSHATLVTDQAIVDAARQADPHVMVFDPLTEHWKFPRIGDHLHPTTAGHQWIAARLLADLRAAGVAATGVTAATAPATVAHTSPHTVPRA